MSERKKNNKKDNKIIPLQFENKDLLDEMDEELEALLKEDLMREADELEAQLNSDPDLMGVGASDDLFLKIVGELKEKGLWEEEPGVNSGESVRTEKANAGGVYLKDVSTGSTESEDVNRSERKKEQQTIQAEGVKQITASSETAQTEQAAQEQKPDLEALYAMLPEEDRLAMETGRRVAQEQEELRQKKMKRQKTMGRVVRRGGTVAAALVLVFGVSMTSEANRRLVSQAWDTIAANFGVRMAADYVDEEKIVHTREKKEIEDFQKVSNELGISEMDLGYLPEGMKYLNYELNEDQGLAMMFYSFENSIFQITMIKNSVESVYYYTLDEDAELFDVYTDTQEVKAEIGEVKEDNGEETYVARIEYKDCNYILNGKVSFDEIEKIIKNIYFL